jgi:hypothetical protein
VKFAIVPKSNQYYRCGEDGSFWSRRRIGHHSVVFPWRRVKPSIIGKTKTSPGRFAVKCKLEGDKRSKLRLLNRLVLISFKGLGPIGTECRHINGDGFDNRITNLRWGTHAQNMQDMCRHGRNQAGVKNFKAKLTWEDVDDMRSFHEFSGCKYSQLARFWKIDPAQARGIIIGMYWKERNHPKILYTRQNLTPTNLDISRTKPVLKSD